MRWPIILLVLGALLPSGCSHYLAKSGTCLYSLKTRDQVHEQFADPSKTGTIHGETYEIYSTRRKIAEDIEKTMVLGAIAPATLGLSEFVFFPLELAAYFQHTIVGQEIRFTYNSDGKTTGIYRDGIELHRLERGKYSEPRYAKEPIQSPQNSENPPPISSIIDLPILKSADPYPLAEHHRSK